MQLIRNQILILNDFSEGNIISIGSINHHGVRPYFMELCPSTMAVVYSGGLSKKFSDEDDPGVRVVASDVNLNNLIFQRSL
jgi:hypothetical protein